MMNNTNSVLESNQNISDEVRSLLDLMASQLGQMGITVLAYEDTQLPWFNRLSDDKKQAVLGNIRFLTDFIADNQHHGLDVLETQLIWRILNQNKFRYSYDLFADLPTDAIIEIYDRDQVQLFRSFQFLKFCSYTLEDIYSRPWFELFDHDREAMEKSFYLYQEAMTGRFKGTVKAPFEKDTVVEKHSRFRLWTEISPLTFHTFEDTDGKFIGFLASFRPVRHGKSNSI